MEPRSLYWAALLILEVVAVLQMLLVRSSVGRAVKAIRDDEIAIQGYSIGLNRYKAGVATDLTG